MKNKFLGGPQKRKALRLRQLRNATRRLKNAEKRFADLDFELAEAKRLLAENEKFEFELRRRQGEELRKKSGAKWKWKGELGYHLICAVKALTADVSGQGRAFRDLHSWATHSNREAQVLLGEHWQYLREECRKKPRQLAARHCEALKTWGPYFERDDALDLEMERLKGISAANKE